MSKKQMLCILFAVIVLALLSLAVAGKSRFPLVNRAVAAVVLPVTDGFAAIGHAGDSVRGYWKALTVLQSDNDKLKKENDELRQANIQMASVFAENQQLRALLEYKEKNRSQKLVAARVIGRSYGDLRDSMYIDAGRGKGLRRDMAVVNNGLVGVVEEVYDDYSRVLLVTSPRCKVGARILRSDSRAIGVTAGKSSDSGMLLMEHIYREANIREGDVVITSGYSGSHPEDILIGTVKAKRLDSVGLLQEAYVQPAADVADVEHVLVITEFSPKTAVERNNEGGQAK